MLFTHPTHADLSQAGSLKQTNLILIMFEKLVLIKINLGYNATQLLSWESLPPTGELRALKDIHLKNMLNCNGEACSRVPSNFNIKSLLDNTVKKKIIVALKTI